MSESFLTDAHHELRAGVRQFAEAVIAPQVADMEAHRQVVRDLPGQIARQGWIGATIGKNFGGMGAGHVAKTLIVEEISRVSAAMGAMVQASQLGTAKIIHYGNEQQKRTWLPEIAAGRCLPTIAVTERASGSHVLGMTTTARRDGDHYVLNGAKIYVGNSHIGHLHGVVARTGQGSNGLSALLVEADTPGLRLEPHQEAMGLHGFSFGEMIFEDCRVPAANLLGKEGDGLHVAYSSSILYGRPNLTAVALGLHQAVLEQTVTFSQGRERYHEPLCALPVIEQRIGQIRSNLMTARQTAYHAVHLLDQGMPCDELLMNAKLVNVELALSSATIAMEIHAAAGLFTDLPMQRYLRDAYHLRAPAGTSDIQRMRLAHGALDTTPGQYSYSQRHAGPCLADPSNSPGAAIPQCAPDENLRAPGGGATKTTGQGDASGQPDTQPTEALACDDAHSVRGA